MLTRAIPGASNWFSSYLTTAKLGETCARIARTTCSVNVAHRVPLYPIHHKTTQTERDSSGDL